MPRVRLYPLFAIVVLVTATGATSTCVVQERVIPASGEAVKVESDGNVYALTRSDSEWGRLMKFDSSGLPLWVQPWPACAPCRYAATLAVDRSGNVYVTFQDISEMVTVKHDAQGVRLWEARTTAIQEPVNPDELMVVDDETGAVYVIAERSLTPEEDRVSLDYLRTRSEAIVTIKYGRDGRQEWAAQYGSGGDASANGIAIGPDGSVAVAGCLDWMDSCVVLKYDAQGALLWEQHSPDPDLVRMDASGSVYVAGYGSIRKYAPSGALLWSGGTSTYIDGMEVDGAGDVYVLAGQRRTSKYGPSGELLWSVDVQGSAAGASALALDGVGNVYVSAPDTPDAIVTVKYDANGAQMWRMRYPEFGGCPYAGADGVAVDERGNVYVQTHCAGGLIKYAQPGGP